MTVADGLTSRARQLRAEMRSPGKDASSSSQSSRQSPDEAASIRIEPGWRSEVSREERVTAMAGMSALGFKRAEEFGSTSG